MGIVGNLGARKLAKNVYEMMLILEPNAYAKDPAGSAEAVKALVEKCEGTVLASRLWNEQRLAYPIDGHRKGVYWLMYVEVEGPQVAKINRESVINESILRHLMIKIDPRLTDTLVALARGEKPAEPEPVAAAAGDEGKSSESDS